jgi:hypothetical protein
VIDVRVGDDDSFHLKVMQGEDCLDLINLITGIDDDRLFGRFISENGTIALQWADR